MKDDEIALHALRLAHQVTDAYDLGLDWETTAILDIARKFRTFMMFPDEPAPIIPATDADVAGFLASLRERGYTVTYNQAPLRGGAAVAGPFDWGGIPRGSFAHTDPAPDGETP